MKISVIKTNQDLYKSVEKLLHELEYKPNKKKILIKPNLAGSFKKSPFITSTKVVEAFIKYFIKNGYRDITIAEGTGNDNTRYSFYMAGYYGLQKKYNLNIIDLNKEAADNINGIKIPKILKQYEYINIAKLKTHVQTGVTLCVKNQKGLIPVWMKRGFHKHNFLKKDLHNNIAELYKTVKPDLSIIDATTGIEGNGPVMGDEVKDINILIGGYNAIDVDCAGTMLMGIDPAKIRHLELSKKISHHVVKFDAGIKKNIKKNIKKFKPPSGVFRTFKMNWIYGEQTCSGCIGSIFKLKNYTKKNILKHPIKSLKIAVYMFILGIDFLTGDAKMPGKHNRIIACGNCCRHLAKHKEVVFVEGCPPNGKDIYNKI